MKIALNLPCFHEEMIVKEDRIKIGEEEELKKRSKSRKICGGRQACRPHTMGGRHACRSQSIEKEINSNFRQAFRHVNRGLSTTNLWDYGQLI